MKWWFLKILTELHSCKSCSSLKLPLESYYLCCHICNMFSSGMMCNIMTMIIILCLCCFITLFKRVYLFLCFIVFWFGFFFQIMLVGYKEGKGKPQSEKTTSVEHLEDKQDLSHSSSCLACVCIHNVTIPVQSVSKLVVTNGGHKISGDKISGHTIKICQVLSLSQHAAMCWVVPYSVPQDVTTSASS